MTVTGLEFGASLPVPRLAEMLAEQLLTISPKTGFPVVGQPLIIPHDEYRSLLSATSRLLRLQLTAIRNIAPDAQGRLAALKADPAAFSRFTADEDFELRHAADMARADVIIGATGFQFIEFNVGGGFGGMVEFEALRQVWQRVAIASGEPQLTGDSPYAAFARLIRQTASEHGARPAALVLAYFEADWTAEELGGQCDFLREHQIPTELADVGSMSVAEITASSPYPIGIVQLSDREAVDAGWDLSRLQALQRAGLTAIPSQSARLIDSKKVLALLSEGLPWMNEADHAFVQRFVPWTRIVRNCDTTWETRVYSLQDLLLAEQSRFVIKGSAGLAGNEVIFGANCSPQEWSRLVGTAVESEYYVAQEVVDSAPVKVRVIHDEYGTHDYRTVRMVVSPFCIGGVPSGCYVRMAQAPNTGLVTRDTGAFIGCLLGAPDPTSGSARGLVVAPTWTSV
ncbi:MAG: hypothetical protein ABI047_15645 [Jatrophihabitantaceae bacterium]